MKIRLIRHAKRDTYTIGKLYIDGVYFCDTLEDRVRDLKNGEAKVFGETAIPEGTYKIIMNMSNRFKRVMPLLLDVPHFAGIRIHSGSRAEHSHGCILVGKNDVVGRLSKSKFFESELYAKLNMAQASKEPITIEIQ